MDQDLLPRLAYLLLLLVAVGGYFVAEGRQKLSRSAQQAAIWGLIFLGVIAGYGLWNDIRTAVGPRQLVFGEGGSLSVPRAPDGHFYVTLDISGRSVDFVVDTGASNMVLTLEDARRVGIDPGRLVFDGQALTANGAVDTAGVTLDEVRLGDFRDTAVPASVNGGELDVSLLGMSYLERFARIEIAGDRLILSR